MVYWVVPYLSYTPEQYFVLYYSSNDTVSMTAGPLKSPSDIATIDEKYNLILTGLKPNSNYFFQIQSINSYGIALTVVKSFATQKTGWLCIIHNQVYL